MEFLGLSVVGTILTKVKILRILGFQEKKVLKSEMRLVAPS